MSDSNSTFRLRIYETAAHLLSQGMHPGVHTVRKAAGGGATETVAVTMRDFWIIAGEVVTEAIKNGAIKADGTFDPGKVPAAEEDRLTAAIKRLESVAGALDSPVMHQILQAVSAKSETSPIGSSDAITIAKPLQDAPSDERVATPADNITGMSMAVELETGAGGESENPSEQADDYRMLKEEVLELQTKLDDTKRRLADAYSTIDSLRGQGPSANAGDIVEDEPDPVLGLDDSMDLSSILGSATSTATDRDTLARGLRLRSNH